MLNGRSPSSFYDEMIRTNPNFRSFIEANKGKTPEQMLEYKKTRPDLAETYHRIAIQEIQHADLLHAKIVQIVQEAESMNGGDYVVEMKDRWEELHHDIVSKMAKAKMYNSLYSK